MKKAGTMTDEEDFGFHQHGKRRERKEREEERGEREEDRRQKGKM